MFVLLIKNKFWILKCIVCLVILRIDFIFGYFIIFGFV